VCRSPDMLSPISEFLYGYPFSSIRFKDLIKCRDRITLIFLSPAEFSGHRGFSRLPPFLLGATVRVVHPPFFYRTFFDSQKNSSLGRFRKVSQLPPAASLK